jgi:predicted amidohydrolase YtcJ
MMRDAPDPGDDVTPDPAIRPPRAVDRAPDLILVGGPILTLADSPTPSSALRRRASSEHSEAPGRAEPASRQPPADGLAVSGGCVAAVGAAGAIAALAGSNTRVVQLHGRCVLPGFIDAHAHPLAEGVRAGWLDLLDTPDRASALERLAAASRADTLAATGTGYFGDVRWIEATYHPARWPDRRDLTREEIDRVAPDIPVLVHHGSGHAIVANSAALSRAGRAALAATWPGATVERDTHGEPTGLVRGSDPVAPFAAVVTPLSPEDLRAAVRVASGRLAADGVTSVTDADLGAVGDPLAELAAYVGAAIDGDLAVRLTLMPGLARLAAPDEDPPRPEDIAAFVPREAAAHVRIGPAKFYADGALSTADAWLREPYADRGARDSAPFGRPARDPEELVARVIRAHRAGWQIGTHGIGDAGIDLALRAYDEALAASPRPDHRHRVEHAMLMREDLLERMVRLGVVAVIQPEFIADTGDVYRERLGAERAAMIYDYRRWLDAGLAIAFGTDRPITRGRPLDGVRSVFRHAGPSGTPLARGVRPTVVEAFRAWTADAAWATRDEGRVGRIAAGMAADLIVLDRDPTVVAPEAWAAHDDGVEVVATLVGGTPVFGADALD